MMLKTFFLAILILDCAILGLGHKDIGNRAIKTRNKGIQEVTKENSKREAANFDTLKNETSNLATKIGNLTNNIDIIEPVVGTLSKILSNINLIMDKLTTKIEDSISKSNWTQSEEYVDQQEVTELPEPARRSIANETEKGVKGLFANVNRIVDKVMLKIEDSIEKANWTKLQENIEDEKLEISKRQLNATQILQDTTAQPSTTTNQYQKMGEFYKNKYADKNTNTTDETEVKEKREALINATQVPVTTTNTTAQPSTTTNKYQKMGEFYKNKFAGKYINVAETDVKEKRELNMTQFNDRYTEAGKEFANALQALTLDLINSFGNETMEVVAGKGQ